MSPEEISLRLDLAMIEPFPEELIPYAQQIIMSLPFDRNLGEQMIAHLGGDDEHRRQRWLAVFYIMEVWDDDAEVKPYFEMLEREFPRLYPADYVSWKAIREPYVARAFFRVFRALKHI